MPDARDDDEVEPGGGGAPTTTVVIAGSGRDQHALLPRLRLRVLEGPDAGGAFGARGDRIVVGTADGADVVLHDRTVSRYHCEIVVEDERVVIRDLGSRNGTLVDGVSVLAAHLGAAATIRLGRTALGFEIGDERVKLPLSEGQRFGSLVGASVPMRAIFAVLERAARSDATVLLEGETGTGKEAAAESIHAASARRDRPFVVVDCGAIPPALLESELFGHERGAFTGAVAAREGAFAAAAGGTVFLDEIGELSSDLQPKLLRVLERKEIKPLGQNRMIPVDVRVIAATNRNLRAEVNARRFRSDLYYRLAVLEVRLPPLRERRGDLSVLVEAILAELGAAGRPEAELVRTDAVRAELARHPWPGNVRELRNYLERCLALALPPPLADAPEPAVSGAPLRVARESWRRDFERRYLEDLLEQHGNNVSAAARAAGVDRKYFYRLLWRHGLR